MVWLKADTGLENTYRKLIHTSKADVDWHGIKSLPHQKNTKRRENN